MKRAEVIMVRLAAGHSQKLTSILRGLVVDVPKDARHETIRVFRHEKLESDLCIVLFHGRRQIECGASLTGLRLAAALKEFGIVHHTTWNEVEAVSKPPIGSKSGVGDGNGGLIPFGE